MANNGFNHFGDIANQLEPALSQIIRKTALDAQKNVQAQIRSNGQVDTGFMVNSVYTKTTDSSTYTGGEKALPEVGAPPNATTAYVAVAANYGAAQNYGTRFMPPRPFFEPGIEAVRSGFLSALSTLESLLKGGGGV